MRHQFLDWHSSSVAVLSFSSTAPSSVLELVGVKLKGMEREWSNTCEIEQEAFFCDSVTATLNC